MIFGRILRVGINILGVLLLALLLFTIFRILFKTSTVSASNLYFYPQFCAGGWENPHLGSGEPQNISSRNASDFNNSNSAYLESGVASQIFCGFFPIETREDPPREVKLRFHWMMDFGRGFIPNAVGGSSQENPQAEPAEPEVGGEAQPSTEATDPPASPSSESVPAPVPDLAPLSEPVSEPAPTPSPVAPSGEVSLFNDLLKALFKTAEAQGIGSSEDYLSISYSLDGVRWIMVGRVNHGNWQDFSTTIPISSWDDLSKIQVMLNVLPTVGSKPGIYLDGVSVGVEYDRPFTEAVTETVEDTTANVVSAVDMVAEQIVGLFVEEETPSQTPKETERVIVKEKVFSFSLGEGRVETGRSLPWYSNEFRDKVSVLGSNTNTPDLAFSEDGRSLVVSGQCEEALFVILLWKNVDDYINKPGSFASNFADHCYGGRYQYDLKNISKEIGDGLYYLLVGSEDESNPWVPASALVPVNISSTFEERVIER